MATCNNCGHTMDDVAVFCPQCGMRNGQQAPGYGQPVYNQPMYYGRPKIPGRGFGIAGMVLGIVGLFYSFYFLVFCARISEYAYLDFNNGFGFLVAVLMFASMSVMAVCFSYAAQKRGYENGIRRSGLILGIIGGALYLLSILLLLSSM